ncbi:MAG: hypothetical protein HY788_13445 [Deltaproteobacteria bacterium]|nr:hypothetical protein [Deltaproteobacteria bacterium]
MSEFTIKRLTEDSVELRLVGPVKEARAVRDFAEKNGFVSGVRVIDKD